MLRKIIPLIVLMFFASSISFAGDVAMKEKQTDDKIYRVGIMLGQPPFSYVNKIGQYEGLTLKLWEFIAKDLNIQYEYVPLKSSYSGVIQDVHDDVVDFAVAPLSVTRSRMNLVDYSRPYFMNTVGIVVSSEEKPLWELIGYLFIRMIGIMMLFLLVSVVFVGTSLWMVERKKDAGIPKGFFKGLSYSMWVAAGTFLGHSFYKPATSIGKGITYSWLFLSLIIMTVVIALATSTLTVAMSEQVSSINTLADLRGKTIALEEGSSVIPTAESFGVKPYIVKNSDDGLKAVENRKADGFMGDYYLMNYLIQAKGFKKLKMAPLSVANDEYAFAFKQNEPLLQRIDKELVRMQENKVAAGVCTIFLGKQYEQNCVF